MLNTHHLNEIIDAMGSLKVLVVGDVMLDSYEHCVVRRISPEAPVPVATITGTTNFLGGAANVAHNVRALGPQVSLVGIVGDDTEAHIIRELLEQLEISHHGIIVDRLRPTILKKRIVSGTQQLIRIDREVTDGINEEISDLMKELLKESIQNHDIIIVSDYSKGLLTSDIIYFLKEQAQRKSKKIFVDSKSQGLSRYSGVYLVKPNRSEAEIFIEDTFNTEYTNLEPLGKKMSEILRSNLVITLGSDGMALFEDNKFLYKKTPVREVFDVSGAGDTVLATIATSVGSGASLEEAVELSNYAAGYVVGRLGTAVCESQTLRGILDTQ